MEPQDEWWTQSFALEDLLSDNLPRDLYNLLGLSASCSGEEIKPAYRRLARQFHTDHNAFGRDTFQEITAAYEILSNPELRSLYDKRRRGPQKPVPLGKASQKPSHKHSSTRLYGDTFSFYADEDIPPQPDEIEDEKSPSLLAKILKRVR